MLDLSFLKLLFLIQMGQVSRVFIACEVGTVTVFRLKLLDESDLPIVVNF
jgi:hypothetical protein